MDAANRRIETTTGNSQLTPHYNGLGDRVGQTVGGNTTDFALDVVGLAEVIQTSEGNTYLHLPGVIVAESAAGEMRYLLSDGLGSVRQGVDETGAVVSSHEFDPYGNPVSQPASLPPVPSGVASQPYGYTGEWWENDVGLLHLRARWYLPETGTFLSRDPVESEPPYLYVGSNPINTTDPSGLCEFEDLDCWEVYAQLMGKFPTLADEYRQIYGILLHTYPKEDLQYLLTQPSPGMIARHSPSNVLGLIRLFEANHFPGKDAKERLEWILRLTGSPRSLALHFSLFPPDDSGFCEDLADQKFYENEWNETDDPGSTRQMGHFLTAVSLGFDPETAYRSAFFFDAYKIWTTPYILPGNPPFPSVEEFALDLIIGHEMRGDLPHVGQLVSIPEQYAVATTQARNHFLSAVQYDRQRNYNSRDSELQAILVDTDPDFSNRDALPGSDRVGNSMQDLRLSVKGWRFGQEIRNGYGPNGVLQTRRQAADWLRREVYDPSRTR